MNASDDASILAVSGLTKRYGQHTVVDGLNLQVERGAIHGLVGLNGSGKTTTLECILGLQLFDGGEINVLGLAPDQLYRGAGRVVGIFDTPSLNPNLTVRQCLTQAELLCANPQRRPADVEDLLAISRFRNFRIKHLSLGNKRRAAIAHALIGNPELIILDEPFNGLDAGGVDDVLALIQDLNQQHHTSFLLSSHQLPYLEQICTHIAVLHRGSIPTSAAVPELLADSSTRIMLRANNEELARQVLATMPDIQIGQRDASGYLHLSGDSVDSAALNKELVARDVAVAELLVERPSLDSLFRELTREQAP